MHKQGALWKMKLPFDDRCLCNKCAKNYCDRTILVRVIVEDVVAYIFLKHGVDGICYSKSCFVISACEALDKCVVVLVEHLNIWLTTQIL